MRPSRPTDISSRSTADGLDIPDWEQDRRERNRRTQDRFRKWTADNALALLGAAVTGLVGVTVLLGLRVEGAPQDLARLRVQTAIDQTAMASRVGKVEDVTAQLLDDNRDLKGAVKEQHYLLCYIIRKQDPAAAGAIESCNGVKAP